MRKPALLVLFAVTAFGSLEAAVARDALVDVVVAHSRDLQGKRVQIQVFGNRMRVTFKSARSSALSVAGRRAADEMVLQWSMLDDGSLAELALVAADASEALRIAEFCVSAGLPDTAETALNRVLELDPNRSAEVRRLADLIHPPSPQPAGETAADAPPSAPATHQPYSGKTEKVRLRAVADIWLSDANNQERNSSSGKNSRMKIKSIQEMAAIRFDASPAVGRRVLSAKLFLKCANEDKLHYIRVSTVNQEWVEGTTSNDYGPPSGATYLYADHASKKSWTWPGSVFADAVMSAGNTLDAWAAREQLQGGWISVNLPPELVYALCVGDTDGLAVMDGGTIGLFNNFVYASESRGNEPYVEAELGEPLAADPAVPRVSAEPAPEKSTLQFGAIKVTVSPSDDVFCWKLTLNGSPVERWRVYHPIKGRPTAFYLEDLPPSAAFDLAVVAVSRGNRRSAPARVSVKSSPALASDLALAAFRPPSAGRPPAAGTLRVWALPGLAKVGPEDAGVMFDDVGAGSPPSSSNAVWNGERIDLFGAKGEYVSCQLCIETPPAQPADVTVTPGTLKGPAGSTIGSAEIELWKNWYARNSANKWQPAYCVPLKHGESFRIPDPLRKLDSQKNQTVYLDIYIPKAASPGIYSGTIAVAASGGASVNLPLSLKVYDFQLPDKLAFWPELNTYSIPRNAHDYYRLAHQHRCVLNCGTWGARTTGSGSAIQVNWDDYDRNAGPLLSGEAFANNRRSGVPTECMYLPFGDSWPTPLSKQTYRYEGHWPGRGEDSSHIVNQQLLAPYIGDALSREYKDAFLAVEKQFIEHFRQKGWNKTEMQCFYGGKATHRIDYGSNMWWTTDEPYHWEDWLALQFFNMLWKQGRGDADPAVWTSRADISRPQWQGRVMDGILQTEYIGGFTSTGNYRRCRILNRETGVKICTYGGTSPDTASNTQSVTLLLNMYLNGAHAHLPWQTLGGDGSLDTNDKGVGGSAILVPGTRFGVSVVADMRLKAFRDGQQIIEYLAELARRRGLQREQLRDIVTRSLELKTGRKAGAGADNADALTFGGLKTWQISELRRTLAELITAR
ncbi:MAG: hypothetical protein JW909_04525 [Planctomycetes bacterium]|nr:hypothetical protein [Planctomycetota bacterium]